MAADADLTPEARRDWEAAASGFALEARALAASVAARDAANGRARGTVFGLGAAALLALGVLARR